MKLTFSNISKSYGQTKALRHFYATMEPGIYALLGPNGSGKSTLMNILTDNLTADEGDIVFSPDENTPCEDVRKMGVRFREKIGFMPQYPGMYPNFTVAEFLWYVAALKDIGCGMPRGEKKEYRAACIEKVVTSMQLEDLRQRKIRTLSGGMKQRLALSQAVLGDPAVLILDEPTAGLDPKQRIAVRNFISQIALDKIVIFATHVVSDIEFIARRVLLLKKGRLIDNDSPERLIEKIKGKVWQFSCAAAQVPAMQEKHRVIGITYQDADGGVLLRVLAETAPAEGAKAVPPTLEDYYLYTFGDEATGAGGEL